MTTTQLQRFTDPDVLAGIGSELLGQFLDRFASALEAGRIERPDPSGRFYFKLLANQLRRGEALPGELLGALMEVERLAAPEQRERLMDGAAEYKLRIDLRAPLERTALELWLAGGPKLVPSNGASEGRVSSPGLAGAPGQDWVVVPVGEVEKATGGGDAAELISQSGTGSPCVPGSEPEVRPQTAASSDTPAGVPALPAKCDTPGGVPALPASQPAQGLCATDFGKLAPWPEAVSARGVLDELVSYYRRLVVMPKWTPEAVSLFTLHTYCWELREVTAYLAIQSPRRRCGKSTLLSALCAVVNRPETAAHVSSPAMFHVISERRPTLIIDETEKVLSRNELMRGIINASYQKPLSYVLRLGPQSKRRAGPETGGEGASSQVLRYCCWCPKVMAQIGRFDPTLADRCIVIAMERKTSSEKVLRLRSVSTEELRRKAIRFALDNQEQIAKAVPAIPEELNDRAADIWEALLVLADLAGGDWPERARKTAVALVQGAEEDNLIGALLLDVIVLFVSQKTERMFSRDLVGSLNAWEGRPWKELSGGRPINEQWLSRELQSFGVRPRTLWIGKVAAKGYLKEDFLEACRRYITPGELKAVLEGGIAGEGEGREGGEQQGLGAVGGEFQI